MSMPQHSLHGSAAKRYWQGRVGGDTDLAATGHRSLGRSYNRWIYAARLLRLDAWLNSQALDPRRLRILDVGCGNGFYTGFWKEQGVQEYLGLDISAAAVAALKERFPGYRFEGVDICQPGLLAEQAGRFHLITLFDVLYHIVDDHDYQTLLGNLAGLLAPGGRLVIFDQLPPRRITLRRHVVYRDKKTLQATLDQAGLALRHAEPLFAWLAPPVFGRPLLDTCIAGSYKIAGLMMKLLPGMGELAGRTVFALDQRLLARGSGPPNHELLVAEHQEEKRQDIPQANDEGRLPAFIPSLTELSLLKQSKIHGEMEQYADRFLAAHPCLSRNRWVADPFHQWSRQWEYPFAWQALRHYLQSSVNGSGRLLDAGSGTTFFPFFLQEELPHCAIHCCDGDPRAEELFKQLQAESGKEQRLQFARADLNHLPYGDCLFDAISCISVLEHTARPAAIVAELARVLKPGGLLLLTFDLGLDGVSELTADRLPSLCAALASHFDNAPLAADLQQQLRNDQTLLTTAAIRRHAPRTLPWRFPRLSLLKSALRAGRLPARANKELTLCCCRLIKKG